MFAQHARRLRFVPENGMKVLVRGRISIYEAGGQYQILCRGYAAGRPRRLEYGL